MTDLSPEEIRDANEVLGNYLNNALVQWVDAVNRMEKGDFSYEEGPPPSPGSLCYQTLFDRTQQLIDELRAKA